MGALCCKPEASPAARHPAHTEPPPQQFGKPQSTAPSGSLLLQTPSPGTHSPAASKGRPTSTSPRRSADHLSAADSEREAFIKAEMKRRRSSAGPGLAGPGGNSGTVTPEVSFRARILETEDNPSSFRSSVKGKLLLPPDPTHLVQDRKTAAANVELLKQVFKQLEEKHAGQIKASELKHGLNEILGHAASESDLSEAFTRLGKSADSPITWDEFLVACGTVKAPFDEEKLKKMKDSFLELDTNGNGYIEVNELKRAIAHLVGEDPSDELMVAILLKADFNKDGAITFDEYICTLYPWFESISPLAGKERKQRLAQLAVAS